MAKDKTTTTERTEGERWVEYVPLGTVKGAANNPKLHADSELDASIGRFGYVEPMVQDDRTGVLVAGHGRLQALIRAVAAGEGAPEGVKVDEDGQWLVPVLRGWASTSDAEAEAYLVGSNELTMMGGWDQDALTATLARIAEETSNLAGTGFDEAQLQGLLARDMGETFIPADTTAADDSGVHRTGRAPVRQHSTKYSISA